MLLMWMGCLHKTLPMPGPTRFVVRGEIHHVVETQEASSTNNESTSKLDS